MAVAQPPPELAPIRSGEGFDEARLARYLREHVPGLTGEMQALQFPGGHANLTYLVRFDDRELVVRRPPLGPVAPRSHDMAREYRVLSRLADRFPQAPRAYHLCEDESVIGALFVVMERRSGCVIRGKFPAELARHADAPRRVSFALVDTMAEFHSVDYAAIGLEGLGKPEGYARRQVEGWKRRWDGAKEHDLSVVDEVHGWLLDHLPSSPASSLVHNDLKFDNCMVDPDDPDHITAILDWDMTTLGDPLIDLGTLLGYWVEAGDPPERGGADSITAQPGFPTRGELAERYAEKRGCELGAIGWYEAFALWKTAVVLQQIYIRFVRGQTSDERFGQMGERVPILFGLARERAESV